MTTTLKPHLSTAELEGRYETAAEPIAKSHFHALWLLSKGYEIDEVAELLSFSTRWVYQLVRRYNEGGPECLGDQRVNNGTEPTIVRRKQLPRCASGSRRRPMTVVCGQGPRWRGGSPRSTP